MVHTFESKSGAVRIPGAIRLNFVSVCVIESSCSWQIVFVVLDLVS